MARNRPNLVCVWFSLFWTMAAGDGDTCPYKKCPCSSPEIYCNELGLTSFPTLTNQSIAGFSNLILNDNKITNVPANCLPLNITEVSFSNNPITTIDVNAFEGSTTTLNSLSFSQALFSRIPDAFGRLHGLTYLTIYDTMILDWNNEAMKNISTTMKTLDLRNVSLNTWPSWFQYLTSLAELNMDVTGISSIPDNAFDNLASSLQGLSISNGSLTSIPKALLKLTTLESLDLEFNNIVDVTFIPQLSRLSSFSLDNNNIVDANKLSAAIRPFADSLMSIEIQNNRLTVIPDLSFLTRIDSLDLSHNRIFDTHSGKVPSRLYDFDLGYNLFASIPSLLVNLVNVTSIVLPYNSIRKIRGSDFHSSVFEVNLANNLITDLSDDSFPRNSSIRTVYLSGNPISIISDNALRNLPFLMILDLQATRITRLPLALSSLNSLESLDVSNCANLVCTCIEKSLASWIITREDVKGNCGVLSVNDFFAKLSPACPGR